MSSLRNPVSPHDHSKGPAAAPVVLVEYGDYQCPYCGAAYPVVKDLLAAYAGEVRFVFRNFPLAEVHPEAVNAAFVAEFAAQHGKFWAAHDLLFENQQQLGPDLYATICERLDLPLDELRTAVASKKFIARIRDEEEGGIRSGVNGTPTFFINGVRVDSGTEGLPAALAEAVRRSA
ncbi:DsbA family protein [Microbacterium sp. ZW T5_45]|uniref:DsbA family protein n=1 Tax=Microbacterium sp. ZW T5_45 TaxID=3378080 RepID=UPI0038551510